MSPYGALSARKKLLDVLEGEKYLEKSNSC